jgi:hypothetical protein
MGKRENFTAERIARLQCESGRQQSIFWDGKTPGLGLRVTAAGSKSYIFETRLNGRTIRQTIGDVRNWSIGKAQSEASRLKVLTNQGIDPRQQKAEMLAASIAKREESKRNAAPALEAWNAYLKARTPKWSARSLLDHQRLSDAGGKIKTRGRKKGEGDKTLPGALLPLLELPLGQIDADRVRLWLKEEAARRPTQANNAFVRLRAFLNWCSDHAEYRDQVHADACSNRMARDELPKKSAKDDCLQREQLPLWFQHVRRLPNQVHAAYPAAACSQTEPLYPEASVRSGAGTDLH